MEAFGKFCASLLGIITSTAIGVLLALYRAKILIDLWVWFIVPAGVKPLPFATAIGVNFIIVLMFSWVKPNDTSKDVEGGWFKKSLFRLAISAMVITGIWGMAAIYHHFIR